MATKNSTAISIGLGDKEKLRAMFPQLDTDMQRINTLLDGYEEKEKQPGIAPVAIEEHPQYAELKESYTRLEAAYNGQAKDWEDMHDKDKARIAELEAENEELRDNLYKEECSQSIELSPLCKELLDTVSVRVSEKTGKEVTPTMLIEDILKAKKENVLR